MEQMPDWEAAYVIMGRALIKLGRHSEAVGALNKAVSIEASYICQISMHNSVHACYIEDISF